MPRGETEYHRSSMSFVRMGSAVLLVIAAARAGGWVADRLRQPRVLGELARDFAVSLSADAVGEQRHDAPRLSILFGVWLPVQNEVFVMRTDGTGDRTFSVRDFHRTREVCHAARPSTIAGP